MTEAVRMVLGLGSNLGDRQGFLARSVSLLGASPGVRIASKAATYESPPAGGPPQGDYLNSAVLIETTLSPREVLDLALGIERSLGRVRPDSVRWGPRTIDIDLLWVEGQAVSEPGLVVPHPRLLERSFALLPLLDVAPDARDPVSGELYKDLGASLPPLPKTADIGP